MPDWESTYVSEIAWDIETDEQVWSGTDSPVSVDIVRDGDTVITLSVEPGGTDRLDRGDTEFHWWDFRGTYFAPGDFVRWVGGLPYPEAVEFPDGVEGSLECRFRIHGDDMWTKDRIDAYVRYTEPTAQGGTLSKWTDDINWTHVGTFSKDADISTDRREGYTTWTLIY